MKKFNELYPCDVEPKITILKDKEYKRLAILKLYQKAFSGNPKHPEYCYPRLKKIHKNVLDQRIQEVARSLKLEDEFYIKKPNKKKLPFLMVSNKTKPSRLNKMRLFFKGHLYQPKGLTKMQQRGMALVAGATTEKCKTLIKRNFGINSDSSPTSACRKKSGRRFFPRPVNDN